MEQSVGGTQPADAVPGERLPCDRTPPGVEAGCSIVPVDEPLCEVPSSKVTTPFFLPLDNDGDGDDQPVEAASRESELEAARQVEDYKLPLPDEAEEESAGPSASPDGPTRVASAPSVMSSSRRFAAMRVLEDLKDYPVVKMRGFKYSILLVAWATVALSCVAECARHTYAVRAHEAGESFQSLADLEAAIWRGWATWYGWVLYEVKSLANNTSNGAVVVYVAFLGLGCTTVPMRAVTLVMLVSGVAYWGLQLAARSVDAEAENTAKAVKSLAYIVASVGWFAVLPLTNRRLAKRLRRGCMFPLAVFNLLLSLVGLIADRVFGLWRIQFFVFVLKMCELIVALLEATFHDLGHLISLMSFFMAYPLGLTFFYSTMQKQLPLGSTMQALVITTFALLAKANLFFIARGAVTHHQRAVVVFPIQLLEHFWTKCLLASTPIWSLDFVGASLVQSLSLLLQSTQHGRQTAKLLLSPVLSRSPTLTRVVKEMLLIDQPDWKALMLIEFEALKASQNVFADIVAITGVALLVTLQWLLEHTDADAWEVAFEVGRGSKQDFVRAWFYLLLLNLIIAFCASRTRSSYVARVQEKYLQSHDPCVEECTAVEPVGSMQSMGTLENLSESKPVTSPHPGEDSDREAKDCFCCKMRRVKGRKGTHLERYIKESMRSGYHERFEVFRQLTPQTPALLMDPDTHAWSFHNILFARYFGFFVASCVFIITQTLYLLALTANLVDG